MKNLKWAIAACMALFTLSAFSADTANHTYAVPPVPVASDYNKEVAPTNPEMWVVSLGGVGSTITSGDSKTGFGVDLSVGRTGHLLLPLEAGIRQNVSYNGSDTLLTTAVYSDWTLLTYKKLDLFGGLNVGMTYGNTKPLFTAAPEGGIRWWVKKDVAIQLRAAVPFNLSNGDFLDRVQYTLGFQVKF